MLNVALTFCSREAEVAAKRQSDLERMSKALKEAASPVRTGTCRRCGGGIFNRRADAAFCSTKCRTAACRKALPTPTARRILALEALVQQLRNENERLQASVQRITEGDGVVSTVSATDTIVSLTDIPTDKERALATAARAAKRQREEERAARVLRRKGHAQARG